MSFLLKNYVHKFLCAYEAVQESDKLEHLIKMGVIQFFHVWLTYLPTIKGQITILVSVLRIINGSNRQKAFASWKTIMCDLLLWTWSLAMGQKVTRLQSLVLQDKNKVPFTAMFEKGVSFLEEGSVPFKT